MGFSDILIDAGIDRYVLLMILYLPILGTIVSISRHVIGSRVLAIYVPIVLTYALAEISLNADNQIVFWDGIKYGLFLIAIIFAAALTIYSLLRPVRLHYYPKIGFVFSAISIIMLTVLYLATLLERHGLVRVDVFAMVLIAVVTERLMSAYAKHGWKKTTQILFETLVLTVLSFALLSWDSFQTALLQQPWVIGLALLANLLIGRYSGLRIREFFRFYSILDKDYSNEDK